MKIKKFGHCCLLIEEKGLKILTDPGLYTDQQNILKDIDVVLITHEHPDHLHIDSLKEVMHNNPYCKVISNTSVGNILKQESIPFSILEDKHSIIEKNVLIEGYGDQHAVVYTSLPTVQNIGYFIANRLFYPGDAFTYPKKTVEILALPVAGPWMKISEAIDYALDINPQIIFPVHESILVTTESVYKVPALILEPKEIRFMPLEINKEYEFH